MNIISIILTTLLILSWITFVLSVLLMNPKWWLGFGIAWIAWSNEYWSKKSIETTLKKAAYISAIIFIISALLLPYFNK